jgi:SAM-dependent methyltransferase
MSATRACLVCGYETVIEHQSGLLSVELCRSCGHRRARHHQRDTHLDYYENAPSSLYVQSLGETRKRQARNILRRVASLGVADEPWLDFGCGRGWFLQQARAVGRKRLAGFDASEISRGWLKQEGFASANPRPQEHWPDWSTLPEMPAIVSFFDVIEHFEDPAGVLERILREIPELKWIVLKVPVSDGFMFRMGKALRSLAPGIYDQLFQVGTFPPHFQYFSRRSMERLLGRLPAEVALRWGDREVENLFWRIAGCERLPGGELAAKLTNVLPRDTMIWAIRIRR